MALNTSIINFHSEGYRDTTERLIGKVKILIRHNCNDRNMVIGHGI